MSNLVCQICGYEHHSMISPSHLKKHGITGEEYKTRFPGCALRIQSAESRLKSSASKRGALAWNKGIKTGPNSALSIAKTGVPNLKLRGQTRTPEQRANISQATKDAMIGVMTDDVKQKIKNSVQLRRSTGMFIPPMFGKTLSESSKQKISAALKKHNTIKSDAIIEKFKEVAHEQHLVVNSVIDNYWFDFSCATCNNHFTFSRQVFRKSTRDGLNICPVCFPRNAGRSAVEIDFYNAIKKLCASAIPNDRAILGGKEIDVLIPELKVGFEFTGLYWHAEKQSPEKRHLLWKKQHAANKGIKLYTVFEDEWNNSPELVMSRVSSILGLNTHKLYARKCNIAVVPAHEKNKFLVESHLQGKDTSSTALGLYFNGALVALATFKKTNMSKGGTGTEWELSRFCTQKNITVVGGASKLIKHFMKEHNAEKLDLISYADSRWSSGGLYKSIGFTFTATTAPSFWYLTNSYSKRVHRSAYMKHRLVKSKEDLALTGWQLAQRAGLDRIWDCGTTKWTLKA